MTYDPELVERVARALADNRCWPRCWESACESERAGWRDDAQAALAAAWEWVKAEDAPVEWEGREVWIYEPWTIEKIRKRILPFSYSRLPSHCAGAMVMLSITPPPPEAK